MQADREVSFEIKEHIGVIARFDNGWNRELNLVSWNGKPEKYDIRDWDLDHERMGKGVTLLPIHMRRMVDLYLGDKSRKAVQKTEEEQRIRAENREKNPRRQFDKREESYPEEMEEKPEDESEESLEVLFDDSISAEDEGGAEVEADV